MTDSELVQALQQGHREVFSDLVDRYRDMVLGLCQRIAGNPRDADELAHDTFVEAYLKIAALREPEKLAGWLRTIALNLCRMWYRRRKHAWAELPDDVAAAIEPDDEDPALLARMSLGLTELPAPQRLVLVLHYFEQMSYEQVADFLDVPIGTVMSRLHRARRALREILEAPCPDEDIPMSEDDRFKQEIQAEIAVLLEMFGRESGAAERLTVILQHSPERFGQLIAQAEDEAMRANLAILLPRLGAGAMDAALGAAFSPDPRAAGHASDLLRRFLANSRPVEDPGWEPSTPGYSAYLLTERLTSHPADAASKAELLLDLLDACENESLAALVTNVLLCHPAAALGPLVEWFRGVSGKDSLYESAWRLYALCRAGTRFCREVTDLLGSQNAAKQLIGLAGAEAVGRCLDLRWLREATPERLAFEVRFRAKWPPLRSEDLDRGALGEMVERTADLLDHPQAEVRNGALAALGRLQAADHVKRIIPHAVQEDASTRLAAIRALAEIGDTSASGVLMHVASGPDSANVRRAAVETLGRLKAQEAEDLLVGLLQDADPQVQEAAVAALAEVDTPKAQAALEELIASGTKRLQKVAARIVYSRQHAHRPAGPAHRPTQSQRIRGGTLPSRYSSIGAVLRFALPEVRPYDEQDLTRRIAAVCIDYSLTRRRLVDEGWMTREAGQYELSEQGETAWRIEQFIATHYIK